MEKKITTQAFWTVGHQIYFFFERIYTAITGFNGPKNHHYYIVLMWLLPEDGI